MYMCVCAHICICKCVYMCICLLMFMCVCRCMCPRGQKKAWDPLDLKLQVVVNCPVWVPGTKSSFSTRAMVLMAEPFLHLHPCH